MAGEKDRVDAYLETVKRLEPDIALCNRDIALTSIAVSLKRIADQLEGLPGTIEHALFEALDKSERWKS
jgi:hypothetical protein